MLFIIVIVISLHPRFARLYILLVKYCSANNVEFFTKKDIRFQNSQQFLMKNLSKILKNDAIQHMTKFLFQLFFMITFLQKLELNRTLRNEKCFESPFYLTHYYDFCMFFVVVCIGEEKKFSSEKNISSCS